MRKFIITLSIVVLMAGIASGQVGKPLTIYFGGGVTMPKVDYGQATDGSTIEYNSGLHGLAAIGLNFVPKLQLMGKVEYHRFKTESDTLGLEASFRAFMYGAAIQLKPPMQSLPIKIRGLVGVGMVSTEKKYGMSIAVFEVGKSFGKHTDFYYEVGAIVEFGVAVPVFLMARYVSISTEGEATNIIPITVGFKF